MKSKALKNRYGFTLIELIQALAMSAIVILAIGVLLYDSQRGWNTMYERVYGDVTTEAYAARKAFDAICRKSSVNRYTLGGSNEFLEVYYYQDGSTSSMPDRYARFYEAGSELVVEHGDLQEGTYTPDPGIESSVLTLATNVTSARFFVSGSCVQMIATLDDGENSAVITTSAVRHNQ
jgi:type II secretory pathway pseudopilin PulG